MLPLWEGYDEWSHFAYLQHLVDSGEMPFPDVTRPSREIQESMWLAPVAWTLRNIGPGHLTHDSYWMLSESERQAREQQLLAIPAESSRQQAGGADPIYESQQPPLYYWLLYLPLKLAAGLSLPSRVFVLRCFSLALASLAIPLGFALSRRVFASEPVAVGIIALATVMPEFMIDICRVGNDSLSFLIYTLLLYLVLRMLEEPASLRSSCLLGVALACGLLTKAYFLTALPAVLLLCGWMLRERWDQRRRILAHGLFSCLLAVALSGWWYWYIHAATGTWSGQIQAAAARKVPLIEQLKAIPQVDWANAFDAILISHIWFGAASFLQVRSWMYRFFAWAFLLAVAGILLLLIKRGRTPREQFLARKAVPALASVLLLFCLSLLYHVLVSFVMYKLSATNGWYISCLVFSEVILVVLGLLALSPAACRKWVVPAGVTCLAALDVYGVNLLLLPYYHGLIAHAPDGKLQAFHIDQLWKTGFGEVFSRLATNRPFLGGSESFVALWLLYLIATIACVVVAFVQLRKYQEKDNGCFQAGSADSLRRRLGRRGGL